MILYIEYEGNTAQAIITDLWGRTIKQFQLNSYTTNIDLNGFASGVYYIRVAERVEKFVKTE